MAFFGFCSALALRECLSVAIVAMVNHTAVADVDIVLTNVIEDQCPRDPELQYEDGEFNWDRNQQGILLAAFYYGYIVTQVYTTNGLGSVPCRHAVLICPNICLMFPLVFFHAA